MLLCAALSFAPASHEAQPSAQVGRAFGAPLSCTLGVKPMSPTRIVGLLILIGGVVLQPVGWMFSHWLTPVSFAAILAGVVLFLRGREHDSSSGGSESVPLTGREMPGDIHGYSGQMSGGRSTSWESSHSSDSGGSDGGGSGD